MVLIEKSELNKLHEEKTMLAKALVELLEEATCLREAYSDVREQDGWNKVEEDECFDNARILLSKMGISY